MQKMEHKITNHLEFITAGHSTFTMRNAESGKRFTYQVEIPNMSKPETAKIWFVAGLVGSDNNSDYKYIGFLKRVEDKFIFVYGTKSKIGKDAHIVTAFEYVFNKLIAHGFTKPNLEIWHEGLCCRCGRKLTVPESIESGIGPECARIKLKAA